MRTTTTRLTLLTLCLLVAILSACRRGEPRPVGWTMLQPAVTPPPLFHSSFAYDSAARQAIVFGGVTSDRWSDETWAWQRNNWRQLRPLVSPAAREKSAMAYDAERRRIVLFGGVRENRPFDDTWEWGDNQWQLLTPANKPPARCCHALVYDPAQKKVLLYGGWSPATGEFFNDVWLWDGQNWSEISCCHLPAAAAHTMAILPDGNGRGRVVAVPSTDFGNTWFWDGNEWHDVAARPVPARADGRAAYTPEGERLVLFGGAAAGSPLSDTLLFDGQVWSLLEWQRQPPARYGHVLFYDEQRQSILLFGGANDDGLLQDTWEFVLPPPYIQVIPAPRPVSP